MRSKKSSVSLVVCQENLDALLEEVQNQGYLINFLQRRIEELTLELHEMTNDDAFDFPALPEPAPAPKKLGRPKGTKEKKRRKRRTRDEMAAFRVSKTNIKSKLSDEQLNEMKEEK